MSEISVLAGIKGIRVVSESTVVVEYPDGHCRPATELEQRLWALLMREK